MWGLLAALGAEVVGSAINSATDDMKSENARLAAKQNHQYQMELEQKRLEAQKRQNRHDTTTQIIKGMFSLLEAAANSSNSK